MREITSVSVSPNGTRVVIGVCHPDPLANKRVVSWVIVAVSGHAKPIIVPGGDEIFDPRAPGALLSPSVQWSTDGRWFFYVRRDGRQVQLWKTSKDGSNTKQVTHSDSDVIDLGASENKNVLRLELAPARTLLARAESAEYRNGILYDDHVLGQVPLTNAFPIIDRWRNLRRSDSGEWVPPGWAQSKAAFYDIVHNKWVTDAMGASAGRPVSYTQAHAWVAAAVAIGEVPIAQPRDYGGQYTVQVQRQGQPSVTLRCSLDVCTGNRISILGWSSGQSEVFYAADSLLGRLGNRVPGRTGIYAWNPTSNTVRLIRESNVRMYTISTFDGLGFAPTPIVHGEITVATVGADEPPALQSINLSTGASRVLFDPNLELRRQTRGRAMWHSWPTSTNYPGRGVEVLPDGYEVGRRYPAILTTYGCGNGFLRGGSGDNAPEFVAASFGFVAVCVDVTVREMMAREPDYSRIYPIFCDILSGVIADLGRAGIIDTAHVGLSGHSFGANAGAFCISHSTEFVAAAFRHGSLFERPIWRLFDTAPWLNDPKSSLWAKFGLSDPVSTDDGGWNEASVARRAKSIDTPLLIQADDTEYVKSLPLRNAMREAGKPVEMFVFPQETHVLTQPVHRLVNYERQMDWFRFWLKNETDDVPNKREQYDRWTALREMIAKPVMH